MLSPSKRPKSPPEARDPSASTTVNADAKTLPLEDKGAQRLSASATSSTRGVERPTNIVKRVMRHTADKLSHSTSNKRSGSSRLAFALRRSKAAQGSDRSSSGDEEVQPGDASPPTGTSTSTQDVEDPLLNHGDKLQALQCPCLNRPPALAQPRHPYLLALYHKDHISPT